jgi:hypothetical protein
MLKRIIKHNLIILPEVEDVKYLFGTVNNRGKNDETNKLREDIIEKLPFLDEEYYKNPIYGTQWSDLRDKFNETLKVVCKDNFSDIKIKKMAGRNYNYDFNITFLDDNKNIIKESHVEFKHNSKSIHKLPQFLSLNVNSDIINKSYAEFYYDNYIDKYLSLDSEINVEKPEKESYLKLVTSVNYNIHPFFKCLYDKENINKKKEKSDVVDESIKEFLNTFGSKINLERLTEKFKATQQDKMYLLWDCIDFHIENFELNHLHVKKFVGINNSNTIIVESDKYKFKLLLRWRNHKGILNPAWQISVQENK